LDDDVDDDDDIDVGVSLLRLGLAVTNRRVDNFVGLVVNADTSRVSLHATAMHINRN